MKRFSLLAAALISSLIFSSCATKPCCSVPPSTTQMTPTAFVQFLSQVNLTEIKLGGIAQTNSTFPGVKSFGAYMVRSHTEMNGWLNTLAARQGITISPSLNKNNATTVGKLSGMKGQSFDSTYIPAMVAGHTAVLSTIEGFINYSTDPAVKAFAVKIKPIIANHLKEAKEVQAELQKAGELPAAQ